VLFFSSSGCTVLCLSLQEREARCFFDVRADETALFVVVAVAVVARVPVRSDARVGRAAALGHGAGRRASSVEARFGPRQLSRRGRWSKDAAKYTMYLALRACSRRLACVGVGSVGFIACSLVEMMHVVLLPLLCSASG
jgi:hypothetical protein